MGITYVKQGVSPWFLMFLEMIPTETPAGRYKGEPRVWPKISLRMYVVSHENLIAISIHFQYFHLVL
jgi:hypothetical protein